MNILKRSYRIPTSLQLSTFRRTHFVLLFLFLGLRPFAQPGAIDASFNPGNGANARVYSVAVQSDGKILIGGDFTTYDGTGRNRIARLNADGTLDTSFDPGSGAGAVVRSIAVQSDGKILIGGDFTTYNGTGRNYIARLNADGTLDTTFTLGTGAGASVFSVAVQSDGKILICGNFTTYNGTDRIRIARLNADGTLDTSFNPGTGANGQVTSVAVQSDGKILIGGDFTSYNGTTRSRIARLNADGTLDTTFDPGTGVGSIIYSVVVQSDGKILIGGNFTTYNGTTRIRIARLNADGTLDTSFDPGTGANNYINSIAVQSDGKILIVGSFTVYNGTNRTYIARLNADGTLDTSFNPGSGTNNSVSSVAVQSDGKILIGGGFISYNGTTRNRVARLLISCTNPTSGGTIAAAQSGNSPFDPAAFTSSAAASGHSGTLEYKWQSSNTSSSASFNDIASSNSATYNAGALTQTTWYKRLARVSCAADWSGAVESNVLEVMVGVTWNGSLSTNWITVANWTPNALPAVGQLVVIPTGLTNYPAVPGDRTISSLSLASGASLNLNSNTLTLTSGLSNAGSITGAGKLTMGGSSAQSISGTGTVSNLEVNNSTGVTIPSGAGNMQTITGKLTPTAGTLTTNGNLTLRSNASGTARVGAGSASGGYISGNVITQRYLSLNNTGRNGRAWRLVTIPVTGTGNLSDVFMAGQSGADLTNSTYLLAQPSNLGTVVIGHNQLSATAANGAGYDWIGVAGQVSSLRYFTQNATSGSFASSQVPVLTTTYTAADQGYMLFARGDRRQDYSSASNASATVLQATGELKQGTIPVTIPALASAGFVLVGNPYMAVLDLEQVILDNAGVIDQTMYVWDASINGNAFNQGGYRTLVRTSPGAWTVTGIGANPQYIESGSAFFVKPSSSGGMLSIKESHKVDGTPGIAPHSSMTDGPSRLFINLEVTDTANRRLVDGAVAFFDTNYKDGLGDAVDIAPMTNLTAGSITLRQSGKRLSMEGRPWPADSAARTIPVDMRNLGDDAYVIRILPTNMSKEGFTAWLKDRHLNKEAALKTDGETLFPFRRTGDLGIDSSRFEIVYRLSKPTNAGTLTPDDAAGEMAPRLYPNPAKSADVKLSLGSLAPGRYEVQVLDISGRSVMTRSIEHLSSTGSYRILKGQKLSTGQYLIRLSLEGKVLETLQFINE